VPVILDPLANLPANFDSLGAREENATHKGHRTAKLYGRSLKRLAQDESEGIGYKPREASAKRFQYMPDSLWDAAMAQLAAAQRDFTNGEYGPDLVSDFALEFIEKNKSKPFFLYYAPAVIRERFRRLVESGLKGSGDYGMLGIGVYNGQGIDQQDANKNKHVVFHSTYPYEFSNGQIVEVGMDAYTGQVVVSTSPVVPTNPNLTNGVPISPLVTNGGNYLDERIAWHAVVYPQPFGFQAEYTIGRGPQLNEARTAVELGSSHGGYVQLYYNYKCDTYCLNIFPYVRAQEYFGGSKLQSNAPRSSVRETELGIEYQFNRALELTVAYSWSQRTSQESATLPVDTCGTSVSPVVCTQTPYQLQTGNLIRFQLQWSF
jgi:hypothetical protein